ncbi:alpha/beta hydrolase [Flexivirga sp. ID2601S]|uniref:Alpha/beta hydrolase n=1 Tax=Flexivirga aerilata TaxID=1656889 RepID=A0A849AEC3_9MICO|nr:alpha/beta hydrolase [Flexivirga aerilata]
MTTAQPRDRFVELDGTRVHYVTVAGPEDGPTFVLVHGLGGSWANWADVMPLLAERGRVIALDLGGHGMTRVAPALAKVPANLRLLQRFVQTVCDRPAIVAGNSMGGLLTAKLAAADKRAVAGAVLIDPAIPISPTKRPHPLVAVGFGIYATPGLGPRFLADQAKRASLEQQVRGVLKLVTSDIKRVSPELFKLHLDGAAQRREEVPDGDAQFLAAAKSVLWEITRRGKYAATMNKILQPVLLLHGARDKLVSVRAAQGLAAAHPQWTYVEGAAQGHTPMLDYPEWVADNMLRWLDQHPEMARRASAPSTAGPAATPTASPAATPTEAPSAGG